MGELRARVVSQEKGTYRICSGTEVRTAVVSGKYRYEAAAISDYPAVGDYVLAEWPEGRFVPLHRGSSGRKRTPLKN